MMMTNRKHIITSNIHQWYKIWQCKYAAEYLTIIALGSDLSPIWNQATIWIDADLQSTRHWKTYWNWETHLNCIQDKNIFIEGNI